MAFTPDQEAWLVLMYVHLDCNNFFVSCELVSRPALKGTPVVVANNNDNNGGIILALNQEAKAAGLKRGNPIFQVKELIDRRHVTVIDVHHNLYHEISHHIMDVVKQTEMVLNFVQYSVDEFFGEMPDDDPVRLRHYLQQLKDLILQETAIPVSCGAGETYTLASHEKQKSIMYSRTFAHMTASREVLKRELSNYATAAARRLRTQKAICHTVSVFLATNRHRDDLPQYSNDATLRLPTATDDSAQLINAVEHLLDRLYREGYYYKQAGVILGQLQYSAGIQLDMFVSNQAEDASRQKRLMHAIDQINNKFGTNQIHYAIQGHDAQDEQMAGFMRPVL
ncbi:MAG: DUF4113 domain-containing protein [Paludibacteraceae bacterium]